MAKGSIMLQIAVEQIFSAPVTHLPEVWTVALQSLDGDRTIVREIATEKSQAAYLWATDSGHESGELALSDGALSDLWLVFPDLRRPPKILHAPSHVPSPPIDGARLVLLRVRDFGFTVESPGVFSTVRRVSSHAYVDEVLPI
jgi:hypothetical protein